MTWARILLAAHNLIAHPLMEILSWIGLRRVGAWLHDATVPAPAVERPGPGCDPR